MLPLEHCIDDLAVQRLLALCVFAPSHDKLSALCAQYDATLEWTLFGFYTTKTLTGLVGIRESRPGLAIIQHIAVLPQAQRQGVGRLIIQHLIYSYQFHRLEAETDADAVEFYRCCGFTVHKLGEVYSGVERFRCILDVTVDTT